MNTITKVLIIAICSVALSIVWFRTADASTHDDCVAYWSQRTASWNNAPSAQDISNNPVFCGDVQ